MSLKTTLISLWTPKAEKDSFLENELAEMGPGNE